ncbi:type II toxin-antitoxin system PemK/MazF family toxin [Neorhizobium sp. BETTINA12A]|uniref:type II toxin-antitoxin system PemK/MazF family toxin n=1 Tax=Neorhizobium sp. BETTINA12A TaxID=2908924 RepID=UPI001FF15990|nr:type II toxin-antitoxin system PemK/MazF family toxin [Neorhizobium sp. BETTINA12A]MCJ9754774.1 type II toxin-antitoxin system PemK/MazF family toxin [Neorhizobium sp. BETTINA12A]
MSLPVPRPGLVICYSYLWAVESRRGLEEGAKNRPCAIVAARQVIEGREVVTVVPVTHAPPHDPADAVEIPAALKAHLGLDDIPSWIVVTEANDFIWPGPDLRPVPGSKPARYEFGILPPRFFAHLRDKILEAHRRRRFGQVGRTE